MNSICGSQILSKLNRCLESAIEAIDRKEISCCYESCIKCSAILEIFDCNQLGKYVAEVQTVRQMLDSILKAMAVIQLHRPEKRVMNYVDSRGLDDNEVTVSSHPEQLFSNEQLSNTSVSFEDIIGCEQAKQCLIENIVVPFLMPEYGKIFQGIRGVSRNILLYGPPGTGKTLLAEAVAHEADSKLISIRPSDVLSKYQGDSEKFIRSLFKKAKRFDRVVVFIDEFDCMALSRNSIDDCALSRRLLAELLIQLEGNISRGRIDQKNCQVAPKLPPGGQNRTCSDESVNSAMKENIVSHQMVVIAATNRIEDIDEAMVRRFPCKVYVGVPNTGARIALLSRYLTTVENEVHEQDLHHICSLTFGWSASDIEVLTREASMIPVREIYQRSTTRGASSVTINPIDLKRIRPIKVSDFDLAFQNLLPVHKQLDIE